MMKSRSYILLTTGCLILWTSDVGAIDLINTFIDKTDKFVDKLTAPKKIGEVDKDEDEDESEKNDTTTGKCNTVDFKAVADWLNVINIGSFFDDSNKYIFNHNNCFVFLDSFEDFSLWVEPYGFYAQYNSHLKNNKMDFTLVTLGAGMSSRFTITDQVNVGGGVGYFHSSDDVTVNSVYFGPCVQYLFLDGWVGGTVFGVGNFYSGDAQSWDLDVRLETEYKLDPPSDFFIPDLTFHPFLRIDYLNVFELGHKKGELEIDSRNSSFFYSKLGVRFEKIALCNSDGVLTANFDLGWINMTPLSSAPFKCKAEGVDNSLDMKPESKNQLALGFELVGMHHSGLLAGLEYQAALGANAPIQTGRLRFEWNW